MNNQELEDQNEKLIQESKEDIEKKYASILPPRKNYSQYNHIILKIAIFWLLSYGIIYSANLALPVPLAHYPLNEYNILNSLFVLGLVFYSCFIAGYESAKIKFNYTITKNKK